MFGSVFKMRPKAGKAAELQQVMMTNPRRPDGMITAYLLSEDAAGNVWGFAVFQDEKSYRANAADPAQSEQYEKYRALLDGDPEWHDGSIEQRPA
jgi:hypothetical protein